MSKLIPFNESNENLLDDNFESIDYTQSDEMIKSFDNDPEKMKLFSIYNDKINVKKINQDIKENFIDGIIINNDKDEENIESFSNENCPVCWGDKTLLTDTSKNKILTLINGIIQYKKDAKYIKNIYFVPENNLDDLKSKPLVYGDIVYINTKYEQVTGKFPYKAPFKFIYNPNNMNFYEHVNSARKMNAELASITSLNELNAIKKFPRNNYWLGGKRIKNNKNDGTSSTWKWIDGSKWSFTYWHKGQPDNYRGKENCVHITTYRDRSWNDLPWHYKLPGIYKIPAEALRAKKYGALKFIILPGPNNTKKKGEIVNYGDSITFKNDSPEFYRSNYLYGRYFKNIGIPNGYELIRNPQDCKRAAQASDIKGRYYGQISSKRYPPGCASHHNYYIFYNKNLNQDKRSFYDGKKKQISKKSKSSNISGNFEAARGNGQLCSVQLPKFIDDGNCEIKKILVRCDDHFDMHIDGKVYKGRSWNKTYTFTNIPIYNKLGFTIAFRCYNGGGPGCLIAQIELQNGSIIVTDGTWEYSMNPTDANMFLNSPNSYTYKENEWRNPAIVGINMKGKLRWNGLNIPAWDRYFVDRNFSSYATWITQNNCFRRGNFYFKKTIGRIPNSEMCRKELGFGQALCYLEANPDVKNWAIRSLSTTYKFEYNPKQMKFHEHEKEAKKRGGHLASILNNDEWKQALKYLFKYEKIHGWWGFWIGGYRTNNESTCRGGNCWAWTDGKPWSFTKWWPNYEPNNYRERYIHMWMRNSSGTWNDLPGKYELSGLYKVKALGPVNINELVNKARWHWKYYGCYERRDIVCSMPPSKVGLYDYQGCFYQGHREKGITDFRGNVKSLQECAELAEKNKDSVFGVTKGDECYTGNNLVKAKKYGRAKFCPRHGTVNRVQVYNRSIPYEPSNPKINVKNFSEKFTNKKLLNKNYIIIILLIIFISILFYYNCT